MFLLWALGFASVTFGFNTACEPAVGANAASTNMCYRKNCNGTQYDSQEATCCENKLHPGASLSCCGKEAYNPETDTCCKVQHGHTFTAGVTQGLSEEVSKCCDLKAYNPVNEMCCQSTITAKSAPVAECCGKGAYDVEKQLCCGPINDKRILIRNSSDHQCCYHGQFNTKTECCCFKNNALEIQPKDSSCCEPESISVTLQRKSRGSREATTLELQHNCIESKTRLCGSTCYNPKEHCCCERKLKPHWFCASGQSKARATVYNPLTHVCCDGCVSVWNPWMDQCCGETPYGLAQRGVLCCNNTLYKDREDGEECSEMGIPYNPAKGTICCSQFHGSPGQHCCGTEIYHPHAEICCNGHRHPKSENIHCCGVKAYNIKDPQMTCCAGTLYNLTSLEKRGGDAQCCGSILQKPQDICCSSQDTEVLYSAKSGFRCCGHLYYNSTLWSCCAGRLRSIHGAGQDHREMSDESRFLSVNNLNKTYLCKKMHIGIVESVSLHSIVFRNVLKIHGKEAKVTALPLPHILRTADRCSFPKPIPGKTYIFNEVNVFTAFNRDSVLQSLHVIISMCSP